MVWLIWEIGFSTFPQLNQSRKEGLRWRWLRRRAAGRDEPHMGDGGGLLRTTKKRDRHKAAREREKTIAAWGCEAAVVGVRGSAGDRRVVVGWVVVIGRRNEGPVDGLAWLRTEGLEQSNGTSKWGRRRRGVRGSNRAQWVVRRRWPAVGRRLDWATEQGKVKQGMCVAGTCERKNAWQLMFMTKV